MKIKNFYNLNKMEEEKEYIVECKRIIKKYPEEIKIIGEWEYCQLSFDFLGFLNIYYNLNIPKEYIVIDFGCNQAVQAIYFKNNKKYIGVDSGVPNDVRFPQNNVEYYELSIQDYINKYEKELDKNNIIAICSYVPDKKAWKLIKNTFPNHYIVYCDEIISDTISGGL